jgi:hypothetical protein
MNGIMEPVRRPIMTTCAEKGCSSPARARGLCMPHYLGMRERLIAAGEWDGRETRRCGRSGCSAKHYSSGLCQQHYSARKVAERAAVPPTRPTVPTRSQCRTAGCEKRVFEAGLCVRHHTSASRAAERDRVRQEREAS